MIYSNQTPTESDFSKLAPLQRYRVARGLSPDPTEEEMAQAREEDVIRAKERLAERDRRHAMGLSWYNVHLPVTDPLVIHGPDAFLKKDSGDSQPG